MAKSPGKSRRTAASKSPPKRAAESAVTEAVPETHAMVSLRDDMNRLFDDFFRGFPTLSRRLGSDLVDWNPFRRLERSFGAVSPSMDIRETDKAYIVSAELPGMDESDIEVVLSAGTLTIKGEKREERKQDQADYHVMERRYGSFRRSFRVPDDADADGIDAGFKKGVLTVTVPKAKTGKESKRIEVTTRD